jgi:predicted secreted protein
MTSLGKVSTFGNAPKGATAVDSITTADGSVVVEYGNHTPSDGSGGPKAFSTIVQYDRTGKLTKTYAITGSVDGLKYNPYTGQIWALQNQDGNSTISIIDPKSGRVTGPLGFANPSGTRGYDDVVFKGNKVFLSYTNPATVGDPTLVELVNGDRPTGTLVTSTVLAFGATGFDTVTGKTETIPQTDPDSLKLAPNGDLLLTGGADGTIIDVQNPGSATQAVAFTTVIDPATGKAASGLDDVIKPGATSGTFYLTDTATNEIYSFHATGLNTNDYYASVSSLKSFGQVDPTTGAFTALVDAGNAPGMNFSSPHGVAFVPDANAPPMAQVDSIKTFANAPNGATKLDSITIAGKYVFTEYGNGVDSTGAVPGTSTIMQYDRAGNFVHAYSIEGSVDGLKYNPETGLVWALQNQDGRSSLSLIDPNTQKVTAHFDYANASTTRGYDDVVFKGSKVFLSYTNPTGNGDATIVELLNGPDPKAGEVLRTAPVLLDGAMGYDTVSGKTEIIPQSDPDSLKLAANGDLIFSSGAGGTIIDVQNPGTAKQAVAFTPIQGIPAASVGNAGLDDVITPTATSGTFYVSDATDGRVLAVHTTGLDTNAYYASVAALGAFGQVDKTTGAFTALISQDNAPGFTFGSPHGVAFVPDAKAAPSVQIGAVKTFQAPTDGSNAPDSVTLTVNGSLFVEYGNGSDSTGQGGSSTIVQYDRAGKIEYSYSISGSVDGLKYNPYTGQIWALQNQDGNSTLTLIDPKTHIVSAPLSFAATSATRGYDDVVFRGDKVFLSFTNPNGVGDPTLVELEQGDRPSGTLTTSAILKDGATGLNMATGKTEIIPQNDPDSLKLASNGDLLFSSGADGTIVDVKNPGAVNQSVAFTTVIDPATGRAVSGLDDVIKPGATSGPFYMTDTSTNKVFSFHATGLDTNDYYASVGSLKAFGELDPTSGAFTPVLSSNNAPGFDFSSPHGVTFVADGAPDVASTLSFDTARAGAFVDLLNGHDAYIGSTIGGAWTGTGTCEDSTINVPNVVGSAFRDVIQADNGVDRITGGGRADSLYAGSGPASQDTFVYTGYSDSNTVTGYDTIVGFKIGTDKVDLSAMYTDASHLAISTGGTSNTLYVEQTPGTFNAATDLAMIVNTSKTGGLHASDFVF